MVLLLADARGTAESPSLWTTYGPLISALLALTGVALTLWVTGRRERRRLDIERKRMNDEKLDAYRAEQRTALAAVLSSAQNYQREVGHAGTAELVSQRSEPFAHQVVESADGLRGQLLVDLTVARLLIHDPRLPAALDRLFGEWSRTGTLFGEFYEAFWVAEADRAVLKSVELQQAWPDFADAAAVLQSLALDLLKPTIVSASESPT